MTLEDNNQQPWHDPIVSEVRKAREAIFAAAEYDLEKLSQRLRQEQSDSGKPAVTRAPRRPIHGDGKR
jgi:hypothetical protein